MPQSGQQHFERVVKKILDALRRVTAKPQPAIVPVRR
jgi:hypothetical protein